MGLRFVVRTIWDRPMLVARGPWPKTERGALNASIRKWRTIADWLAAHPGQTLDNGDGDTCALCQLHHRNNFPKVCCCDSCPVYAATGKPGCKGTPYENYVLGIRPLAAARDEVEFLKGLCRKENENERVDSEGTRAVGG